MKPFETIVFCLDQNHVSRTINNRERYSSISVLAHQFYFKLTDICDVAIKRGQRNGQLTLSDCVLNWTLDIAIDERDSRLKIKDECKVLNVLHVVLLVITCNELELEPWLGGQVI